MRAWLVETRLVRDAPFVFTRGLLLPIAFAIYTPTSTHTAFRLLPPPAPTEFRTATATAYDDDQQYTPTNKTKHQQRRTSTKLGVSGPLYHVDKGASICYHPALPPQLRISLTRGPDGGSNPSFYRGFL